jgi:rubrerythrin
MMVVPEADAAVRCRLCGAYWVLSIRLSQCPQCGSENYYFMNRRPR